MAAENPLPNVYNQYRKLNESFLKAGEKIALSSSQTELTRNPSYFHQYLLRTRVWGIFAIFLVYFL